jgi:hypothetical protein
MQVSPLGQSLSVVHAGAEQAPATQVSPEGQATPQAPQLFGSVWRSTHAVPQVVSVHPDDTVHSPLVQTWPAGQSLSVVHADASQTPAAQLVPGAQTSPQPPQLLGSVCVSTHAVPQVVSAHAGAASQAPAVQTWPAGHWASVEHACAQRPAAQTSALGQSDWLVHEMGWFSVPIGMSPLLQAPDAATASSATNEREDLKNEPVKALMGVFLRLGRA